MRILFSIEFNYGNRAYCGIVRIMEHATGIEYHVRVMNAKVDKWLYHHHIFREESDGRITYDCTNCSQRVQELQASVYAALLERLKNDVVNVPSGDSRVAGGGTSYYVHRISSPHQKSSG